MSNFWHNNTENPKKNEVIMGQNGFVGLFDGEFVIFNDVANHPNKLLLERFLQFVGIFKPFRFISRTAERL